MTTFRKLLLAYGGDKSEADCRRCGEPISTRDHVGTSESVCDPCRREVD